MWLHRLSQATKTKSELTQTKQVQSVHAKDIDELKRVVGDNSALDDLKAEIAAVKKQAFEVSLPAPDFAVQLAHSADYSSCCVTSGQPSAADATNEHAQRSRQGPRGP